jgi:anti-sigma factor RsiW
MPTDEAGAERPDLLADRRLWQHCRASDDPLDEAARFLDLAAFADGLLDADDHDRVAAWLADDPEAAADVNATPAVDSSRVAAAQLDRVVARACALLPDNAPARVVAFPQWRARRSVGFLAQWGSIAAALALAGWLGFAMGTDTSQALSEARQPSDASVLPELFDPAPSFLRDLGEGLRT